MEEVFLSIADITIKARFLEGEWKDIIEAFKKDFFGYLKEFIVKKKKIVDFYIDVVERRNYEILERKIDGKQKQFISFLERKNSKKITLFYQGGFFLFQVALKNLFVFLIAKNKGFLLHASAVAVDDRAYIFLGRSTAGKSTVLSLLSQKYPPLADDLAIIKKKNKNFFCYPTPFVEKYKIEKVNKPHKIGAIFLLRKALFTKERRIIDKEVATSKLLKQLWTDRENSLRQTRLALEFINSYEHFYDLFFTKEVKPLIKLIEKHEIQNQ